MFIELPPVWIGVLNAFGIPALHLAISWAFTKMPLHWFSRKSWMARTLPGESPQLYEKVFQVRKWKSLLPDAGTWFGGFAKKGLRTVDHDYLSRFASETIRSELAHWAQWVAISACIIWTPMPWAWIILIYAPLSNIPCIVLQRQNRMRLEKIFAGNPVEFTDS